MSDELEEFSIAFLSRRRRSEAFLKVQQVMQDFRRGWIQAESAANSVLVIVEEDERASKALEVTMAEEMRLVQEARDSCKR